MPSLNFLYVNYTIWNDFHACFDFQYVDNGTIYRTTYENGGWWPVFKVDNGPETKILGNNDGKASYGDISVETNITHPVEFGNNSDNFYLIEFFATNNHPTEPHNFSLTSHTDVMIANNDWAEVRAYQDDYNYMKGLTMTDERWTKYTLTLLVRDAFKVENVDTFWFGQWGGRVNLHKWDNTNRTIPLQDRDSAFSFGWVNRTIRGGKTLRLAVLLGVGRYLPSPPTVTVTSNFSEKYLPKQKFNVTGFVKAEKMSTLH